jgi:hypothetical protein
MKLPISKINTLESRAQLRLNSLRYVLRLSVCGDTRGYISSER